MDEQSFSSHLQTEDPKKLRPEIRAAIDELRAAATDGKVTVRKWNSEWTAASLSLAIDLPSRGPVKAIDIRAQEPVLILFHRLHYPRRAPSARSDRRDFPATKLPHLNPVAAGQAPYLCLHRGSIDDWFNQHTLTDFLERVRGWFRDAARNRLIRDDDGFEPTRLIDTTGYAVFAAEIYSRFIAISDRKSLQLLHQQLSKEDPSYPDFALEAMFAVDSENHHLAEAVTRGGEGMATRGHKEQRYAVGILAWPTSDASYKDYVAEIPTTWTELITFAATFGIDLISPVTEYLASDLHLRTFVPITVSIRRPTNILFTQTPWDFVTVTLMVRDSDRDISGPAGLKDDAPVYVLSHREPLTTPLARRVSRLPEATTSAVLLGAGAVGSKVALHLGKGGDWGLRIVDNDTLSPHNLVRHGLTSRALGSNKAKGVAEELAKTFSRDYSGLKFSASEKSALDIVQQPFLATETVVIDCTANLAVYDSLVESSTCPRVLRCELAHEGQLGLLIVESLRRVTRLDDVRAFVFDAAVENQDLSEWLSSHLHRMQHDPAFEEIEIGLGCNADTLQLADDIVSFHAAAFARGARDLQIRPTASVQISRWPLESGAASVVRMEVAEFHSTRPANDPSWSIRISPRASAVIHDEANRSAPSETGGYLFGRIDVRRRTIHITRAGTQSADSSGSTSGFVRGVSDAPFVRNIIRRTGETITYVGDWHSHPRGSGEPSITDLNAAEELRQDVSPLGLPALILIATPRALHPYVFGDHTANAKVSFYSLQRRRRIIASNATSTSTGT